jgi:hypothetical protein
MVRVCSVSVHRWRQTEGDRSSARAADGGRRVWGWLQSGASASLHVSEAEATSPSPSSSCTRASGDDGGGYLSVAAGQGREPARFDSPPALQTHAVSFLQAAKSPRRPPCFHPAPLLERFFPGGSRGYHYCPSSQPTI